MILDVKLIENDQTVALHIDGEKISRIEPFTDRSGVEKVDPDLYGPPGLFDPQVNGFTGVDFNGKDLTPDDVHRAARAVYATGVTTFFPTLTTASFARLTHQLRILKEAIENDPLVSKMCGGIHLEGPYISSSEGPRGVHPRQFIRFPILPEERGCLYHAHPAIPR